MIKQFITVGQIINTHGIKGELKVYPLTDNIKRFRKLKSVFIDGVEREVVWCKLQTDKVILKIDGIDSMNDAETYKQKYIDVKKEDAVRLPRGSYFIAELIGCMVEDTNGVQYGKISDVVKTGSNDVYWIKSPKELLVPALKDVVVSIDVENEKIVIKPVDEWQ